MNWIRAENELKKILAYFKESCLAAERDLYTQETKARSLGAKGMLKADELELVEQNISDLEHIVTLLESAHKYLKQTKGYKKETALSEFLRGQD
jgi:hypothetical protein